MDLKTIDNTVKCGFVEFTSINVVSSNLENGEILYYLSRCQVGVKRKCFSNLTVKFEKHFLYLDKVVKN